MNTTNVRETVRAVVAERIRPAIADESFLGLSSVELASMSAAVISETNRRLPGADGSMVNAALDAELANLFVDWLHRNAVGRTEGVLSND